MDYFNQNEENNFQNSNSYMYQPVREPQKNTFGIASCVCGILALTTICTGVLPIPLGALSIIFAVMGHRKGKTMDNASLAGICLSAVGLIFAAFIIFYTFQMLPVMLENESFRQQMNVIYENMYGMDFDSFLEQYYN